MTLTDKEQARLDELIKLQGQEFTGAMRDELKYLQTKKATVLQNTDARKAEEKVKADKVEADNKVKETEEKDKTDAEEKIKADKVEADRIAAEELDAEEKAKVKKNEDFGA